MIHVYISAPPVSGYNDRAQYYFDQQLSINSWTIDDTLKGYLNTLFQALIDGGYIDATDTSGASDTIEAMYLFDMGSAARTKLNILRPLDTDGAFRLSYSGGFTYTDGQGTLGNGSNGYADTHLNPDTIAGSTPPWSWYLYSRTSGTGGGQNGIFWISDGSNFRLGLQDFGNKKIYMGQVPDSITYTDNNDKGFMATLRDATSDIEFYRNSVSLGNTSNINVNVPKGSWFFFARNITNLDGSNNSIDQYDNHELSVGMVCSRAFSDAQASAFDTAVKNYGTSRGWAV